MKGRGSRVELRVDGGNEDGLGWGLGLCTKFVDNLGVNVAMPLIFVISRTFLGENERDSRFGGRSNTVQHCIESCGYLVEVHSESL